MAGSAAVPADFLRDLSSPLALGAGRHPDKLAERGLGCLAHLAGSPAAGTGVEPFCLAPGSTAGRAGFRVHDLDFPVHAGNGVFQSYLDPHEEICPGLGTGASLAPAKEVKDIPKAGEVGGESPAAVSSPATGVRSFRGVRERLVAHVVVLALFLFIGEDAVGLVYLLELLFGTGIFADIWMEFAGEVPVRFLDLLVIGTSGYAEGVVVIRAHY